MELKNLETFKDEIKYLEEAEELLHELYFGFGSYGLRNVIEEHKKDFFPTDIDKLIIKLNNHFNFDEWEEFKRSVLMDECSKSMLYLVDEKRTSD